MSAIGRQSQALGLDFVVGITLSLVFSLTLKNISLP
jgi:hypothetical protein